MRNDYKIILNLINKNSKILDLGCGNGALLSLLINERSCNGSGVEIDENEIYKCVEKGITVSHSDIDTILCDYSDKRFDYVILNESLQQVLNPRKVILESLRVGKKVIVGIPNFCHWKGRLQIFFRGRVPVTKELPDQWYDTPNLRFLSLKDFRYFCHNNKITILNEIGLCKDGFSLFKNNLFATMGLFLLEKNNI